MSIIIFLTPVLNSQGIKKLRCAIQNYYYYYYRPATDDWCNWCRQTDPRYALPFSHIVVHKGRCSVWSSGNGRRTKLTTLAAASVPWWIFSKSRVWDKVLLFWSTRTSLRHNVGYVDKAKEAYICSKEQLAPFVRFERTPTCHGQTEGHKIMAYTALVKW